MTFSSMDDPPLTEYELLTEGGAVPTDETMLNGESYSSIASWFRVGAGSVGTSRGILGSAASTRTTRDDMDLVAALHDNPILLPPSSLYASLQQIFLVVAILTVVQLVLLRALQRFAGIRESTSAWKGSYQLTNLLVNLTLAVLGVYHFAHTLALAQNSSVVERIMGREDVKLFADIQIGYQLWSLPIGYWFVNESMEMMGHHLAVICVGCLSAFFTNGYRYYTPFFYGVIELSSVPLAVMNSFKNHPHWIQRYPKLYNAIRVTFAISFLCVRVVMWTPQMMDFLKLCTMMVLTSRTWTAILVFSVTMASALVLTYLQFNWAYRIVKGLIKMVGKKGKGGGSSGKGADDGVSTKATTMTKSKALWSKMESSEEEEKKMD